MRPESRDEAHDPDLVEPLDEATGVFMTGGNQLKLSAIICGTPVGDADRRGPRARRPSSAAPRPAPASSPRHMVAFGVGGATPKQRMTQVAAGPRAAAQRRVIDQHFDQRNRYGRLLMIVAQSPQLLGIGVDEDTCGRRHRRGRPRGAAGRRPRRGDDPRPGRDMVTNAYEAKRSAPLLASGVVLHVLPAGAAYDLTDPRRCCRSSRRGSTPEDAAELAEAQAATCARWPATSPPATSSPAALRRRLARKRTTRELTDATPRPTSRTEHRGDRAPHARTSTIVETRVYRGANVWSYDKAIHLVVDLGVARGVPHQQAPRLHRAPARGAARPARTTPARAAARGGFVERLHEGTWLGHVAEHVALALQQVVGHDIRRGKTRQVKGEPGRYNVIYGYVDEQVGLAAGRLAVRLVNHLVAGRPGVRLGRPSSSASSSAPSARRSAPRPRRSSTRPSRRDIPWIRLNQYSLVQLGQGVHAKRIRATMTSETSSIAVDIASDKDLTTRLLGAAGLPVPKQESVRTADQAVAAARADRLPGRASSRSTATTAAASASNLQNDDDVREAFPIAEEQSRRGVGASSSRSSPARTTAA